MKDSVHSWKQPPPPSPPPTLNQGGGFDFLKFSHKKGKAGKIGGVLRNVESLISTNPLKLSFSLYMCVVWVFLIYTISNSILCVLQEELRLIESNQQIYDFYKKVIFEKQIFVNLKVNFCTASYSFRVIQVADVYT